MKIVCRICGNEFDHPDGKRGTKPSVCPSKECQATQNREYQAKWLADKRAGKSSDEKRCRRCGDVFTSAGKGRICEKCLPKPKKIEKPKPDTSKAGWPEDTKKCVECGDFFMDDGRSRLCPICKAAKKEERYSAKRKESTKPAVTRPEPLHLKSIDESLAEAKAMGYSPEEYGKYKAAKTLEKAGRVDINLAGAKPAHVTIDPAAVVEEIKAKIDEKMKEDDMICKECGFDVEPIECGNAVECPACGKMSEWPDALFEPEVEEPCREEPEGLVFRVSERELLPPLKDDEPYSFLEDIQELVNIATRAGLNPFQIFPIAQAVLEKGLCDLAPHEDAPSDYIDPAWGFDRKPMGGSK